MPNSFTVSSTTLFGFLMVLARVAGIFVFVPLPGVKNGPETARIVLSLGITIAFHSLWPSVSGLDRSLAMLTGYLLCEAVIGIAIGLALAFLVEAFQMAAQITGLQAGYGYASTIDPTTQADSGILLVVAQTMAGLLFFTMGLDREVLRIFALSLQTMPPGQLALSSGVAETVVRLGSGVFSTGLRLALPAVALLGMIDLSLALLGRLNSQLQLLTLAFPVKMLVALALLAYLSSIMPRVFGSYAGQVLHVTRQFAGAR